MGEKVRHARLGRYRLTQRRVVGLVLALVALPPVLFAINGMVLANNERPISGSTSHAAAAAFEERPDREIKILAYNIAKCFCHRGGIQFESVEFVEERLARIADVINAESPDLVFLSETIFECARCPVNHVTTLAEATGMHAWAFGENYNFGLPLYRIVGGNAILSQWPIKAVDNPSLAGRKPFWKTANSRRILYASIELGGQEILLGSVHNDSWVIDNNEAQMKEILEYTKGRPAVLAGDFNAWPESRPIELLKESGRFSGAIEGETTLRPPHQPIRIDYIFGPAKWELIEERVIESDASDHRAVVARFRVGKGD